MRADRKATSLLWNRRNWRADGREEATTPVSATSSCDKQRAQAVERGGRGEIGGRRGEEMKIVTYNVNGLRQRVAQHGSLLRLLNSLDADIICFQETKLSRQDLSADLTMPQGYEAFVSCTRTTDKGRTCYSGVATFCRVTLAFSSKEVALPLAAEEGFTGLLEQYGKRDATKIDSFLEGLADINMQDILKVDSEGRCIITDHGHFVLINIYGPRADDDNKERLNFKHLFFTILQRRWESLLRQGRRVCVIGDFNIAPGAIDCCDAGPGFEENPFRKWLRSLLMESGGPFFDAFRAKHPERKEAYTCWPQRVGGEEFNYGTRIDHILIAGQCLHQNYDGEGHNFFSCHVKECDILTQFRRGKDIMSRWNGGRSTKLEGSDHAPVCVSLLDLPELPIHSTPSLAVRYVPEVRGWQQTIVSLLQKRQVPVSVDHHGRTTSRENTAEAGCCESIQTNQDCTTSKNENEPHTSQHFSGENFPSVDQGYDQSVRKVFGSSMEEIGNSVIITRAGKAKLGTRDSMIRKKKGSDSKCSQQTIRSFFQKHRCVSSVGLDGSNTDIPHSQVHTLEQQGNSSDGMKHLDASHVIPETAKKESSESKECVHPCNQDEISVHNDIPHSFECEKNNHALLEWQRIQQRMQTSLPLCKGHGEPCVARFVKKPGPNIGRGFYVCARAKGPASNPEANCGYFKWASVKSRQKQA